MRTLDTVAQVLLISLVLLAPLPLGSVGPTAVLVLAGAAAVVSWCVFPRRGLLTLSGRGVPWILGAAAFLAVLPLVPLPPSWVRLLSPSVAALNEAVPGGEGAWWMRLSLHPEATSLAVAKLGVFAAIFLASAALGARGSFPRRLLWAVFAAGSFQAAYGSAEYLSGHQHIFSTPKRYYIGDATGTYVNKNHFAGILEMALLVGLGLLLERLQKTRRSGGGRRDFRARLVALASKEGAVSVSLSVGIAVMALGLLLSHSRSGLICAALGALLVSLAVVRREGGGRLTPLVLVAGAALAAVVLLTGFERIASESSHLLTAATFVEGRLPVWRDCLTIVLRFPLFGTGLGTFRDIYPVHRTVPGEFVYDHAHNDYLELLVETGLSGALFALILLVVVARILVRGIAERPQIELPLLLGTSGGLVAMLLHETTDFNLHIPANAVVFAALVGAAVAMASAPLRVLVLVGDGENNRAGPIPRIGLFRKAIGTFGACLMILAVVETYRQDHAARLLVQYRDAAGDQADGGRPMHASERVGILERAAATGRLSAKVRTSLALELGKIASGGEGRGAGDSQAADEAHAPGDPGAAGTARAADDSRAAADLRAALDEVRQALRANPADEDAWLAGYRIAALGELMGKGVSSDAGSASRFLEGAIRSHPGSGLLRRKIAGAQLAAGDVRGAAQQLAVALRSSGLDPRDTAKRMLDAGMPAPELLAVVPPRFTELYETGIVLREAGYNDEAEEAWLGAARADPRSPLPWISLSRLTDSLGRHDDAVGYARRGLDSITRLAAEARSELLFCAAAANASLGAVEAALADATRALDGAPRNAALRDFVARMRLARGDASGAAQQWRSLIEELPNDPWLKANRALVARRVGSAYETMNLTQAALDRYLEALRLDPEDAEARRAIERLTNQR